MNTLKYIFLGFVFLYVVIGVLIYFFQERFIFLPSVLAQDFKFQFDKPFEEHFIETENNGRINLLHFQARDSKGLIVYFHGNAGSLDRWGNVVEPLVDLGYDVLIADYRGYGKSRGAMSQKNLLHDAKKIYSFALDLEKEERIVLYGRSLGTGFASYLAGLYEPKLVILETPFYSLEAEANRRFKLYPVSWFLQYTFKSYKYLQLNKAPVYVFHGTEDRIVSYNSGVRLFENIDVNGGRFIAIDGGYHNNLAEYEEYWSALKTIL